MFKLNHISYPIKMALIVIIVFVFAISTVSVLYHGDHFLLGSYEKKDVDFPEDIGVFINSPGYIGIYSGFKNLKFLADIKRKIGNAEIKEAMQIVGLNPDLKTKVADYSLGMKQKLGIAQAIMEGQDILVLDEPFNALDYQTYNDMKEIILRLKEENKTMLLTSHNYEDLESLCDIVYIIQGGHMEQLTGELKRNTLKEVHLSLEISEH